VSLVGLGVVLVVLGATVVVDESPETVAEFPTDSSGTDVSCFADTFVLPVVATSGTDTVVRFETFDSSSPFDSDAEVCFAEVFAAGGVGLFLVVAADFVVVGGGTVVGV
jgi:hypothetical protein